MLVERTADPSASLGMTKGEAVCFGANRMLVERTADPSASLGMTKGRAELRSKSDAGRETTDSSTSVGTEGLADFAEMKKQNGRIVWSARFLLSRGND